jgi:hypothetical protein
MSHPVAREPEIFRRWRALDQGTPCRIGKSLRPGVVETVVRPQLVAHALFPARLTRRVSMRLNFPGGSKSLGGGPARHWERPLGQCVRRQSETQRRSSSARAFNPSGLAG